MMRIMMLAAVMVVSAFEAPRLVEQFTSKRQTSAASVDPAIGTPEQVKPPVGRIARLASDARGHYQADAKMNNQQVRVLVDTGATVVALNETTARRLGIRLKDADFKYRVSTANGIAPAAAAIIKEVRVGRVKVRDVEASVMRDEALDTVLLGMSFLGRLKSFQVKNGELVLRQ